MKSLAIVILLIFCLALSSNAQDKLFIVSPHWEGIRYELGHAFKKHYFSKTGREIEIVWLDIGATSQILRFIRSQFNQSPKGINVDIMFGGGIDPFEALKADNLLTKLKVHAGILEQIPTDISGVPLYDKELYWIAPTVSAFGILCNNVVLNHLRRKIPSTWKELSQPEYRGWVGLADPRKSGSVHMIYEIILQAYGWLDGWKVIHGLALNTRSFTNAASQVALDVTTGDIACGISLDSYAWAQLREAGPTGLDFVIPREASFIGGDGIGILKGAPNESQAQLFVSYLMSEEGQKIWFYRPGVDGGPQKYNIARLAVIPKLYRDLYEKSDVQLNPFEWKSTFNYNSVLGSRRWDLVNSLISVFFIENRLPQGELLPLSESEALRIVKDGEWSNLAVRSRIINDWADHLNYKKPTKTNSFLRGLPFIFVLLFLIYRAIRKYLVWR